MLKRLARAVSRFRPRGHCVITVSREGVSAHRVQSARRPGQVVAFRALGRPEDAEADALAALLVSAIDEVDGRGLLMHVTVSDDLARYFIVTPPANSARVQDLRAAASIRFQTLYGDSDARWHLVADWQAAEPFLACAVPRRVSAALEQAVAATRGCLISVTPEFAGAWNRVRKQLGADAWIATLNGRVLTLGLVGAAPKARLVSVRTLVLPEPVPPLAWLREQIARMALLDNVVPPSILFVQGEPLEAWQGGGAAFTASGREAMSVRWIRSGVRVKSRDKRTGSRVGSTAGALASRFASRITSGRSTS
ncbi:conserved protein of unknown function [Pararobbsia alpina]